MTAGKGDPWVVRDEHTMRVEFGAGASNMSDRLVSVSLRFSGRWECCHPALWGLCETAGGSLEQEALFVGQ